MRKILTAAVGTVAILTAATAMAEDYPVDTVTLITHSSPGGGSDVFLRELAKHLAPQLGVDVVVDNVKGGSGAKAMAYMANAPADGSVFYATTPTFIYTSLMSAPENTYKDLSPLVNVFVDPEVIYTAADSSYESLDDLIAEAKKGNGTWGASSPASLERQALEQLKVAAGVEASIVTHDGGGDLLINVLNGTLQIGVGEVQEMQSQLEAGEIKLLATFSGERLDNYPNLPTVKELGYDVEVRKFRGLAAPKGLPDDIIAIWEKAIPALLDSPEYKAAYEPANLRASFLPHADYVDFIDGFAGETEAFLKETGVIE